MLNTERVSPPSLEEGGTVDIKVTSVSKRAQENEKAGLLRSLFLAFVHQSPTHDDGWLDHLPLLLVVLWNRA